MLKVLLKRKRYAIMRSVKRAIRMITINGVSYEGNTVTINNNRVIVDGVDVTKQSKDARSAVHIELKGNVEKLVTDKSVTVVGSVGSINAGGSVHCDDVTGNVDAKGSVMCDDIGGDATAGGSITCDDIKGDANAGGSIIS